MGGSQSSTASNWTGVAVPRMTFEASQGDYQSWLDALPSSLADSATADALRAICDLDLSELQGIEPPRGFGRD